MPDIIWNTIAELLAFLDSNPVRSTIIDISGAEPLVTLLCGQDERLRNISRTDLQAIYDNGKLPEHMAQYLGKLGVVATKRSA
jgi:hypothetical protein